MSAVHIAAAANEVAGALPSTASVSVSKHGIQAVETLNLKAQTVSQNQIRWSRSFDGREILTNPYVRYRVQATAPSTAYPQLDGTTTRLLRDSVRPTCDPFLNACHNLRVTVNNASMTVQGADSHRIVSTTFAPDVQDQRDHYGLNELDEFAESEAKSFYFNDPLGIERQFNNNALRENYPVKFEAEIDGNYHSISESEYVLVVNADFSDATAGPTAEYQFIVGIGDVPIGYIYASSVGGYQQCAVVTNDSAVNDVALWDLVTFNQHQLNNVSLTIVNPAASGADIVGYYTFQLVAKPFINLLPPTHPATEFVTLINQRNASNYRWTYDIYQPLNHPYFRDSVMRDNTLVNCKFMEVEANIIPKNMLERSPMRLAGNIVLFNENLQVELDTSVKPTLIMDLITPSVPMPTLSEKEVSTYHTVTSTPRSTGSAPMKDMASGHIMLAQVPDRIYVFVKSSRSGQTVPTRLGVITGLRIQTPQDAAMMVEMGQETLYQMTKRNGSKQSRTQFMCTAGSVVCIDPERDLGGYTNGVLAPFAFDLRVDFSLPMRNGDETESIMEGKTFKNSGIVTFDSTSERWTMYVVCELQGHLYMMQDGSAKQTKSNLTMAQVSDAVSQGLHHPTTFPGSRMQKMDSGLLAEIGSLKMGDAADDVRAHLRA